MAFPVKFPQFHGNADESWKAYKTNIELAYAVSGVDPTGVQRAAHLLHGLAGKAKKYLELHPELIGKTYQELDQNIGRPIWES